MPAPRRAAAAAALERVGLRARGRAIARPSCPAVSASASRSRARSSARRRSCSPTSRPATSTAPRASGVLALLEALNRAGATIIVITHDRDLAADGSPRRIEMLDGRVVADTTQRSRDERPRRRSTPSKLRLGDLARLASVGLRTRRLRAALSALGIAIGVAAIVAVLGLSASSQAGLLQRSTGSARTCSTSPTARRCSVRPPSCRTPRRR